MGKPFSEKDRLQEDHERGLINENCRLEHQMVVLNIDKERHKPRESTNRRFVTDSKVELATVKKAMCVLEERASSNRSLMLSTIQDRDNWQDHLATTSPKLYFAKRAVIVVFDQLKEYSSGVWMVEVAVQASMKSNLQSYNQAIVDQFKQSIEAYQLSVEGDITFLGMALCQAVRRICANIFWVFWCFATKRLETRWAISLAQALGGSWFLMRKV